MKKKLKHANISYLQGKASLKAMDQKLQSYLGLLSHANEFRLSQALKNAFWVRNTCF